jgi:hypothetical protein
VLSGPGRGGGGAGHGGVRRGDHRSAGQPGGGGRRRGLRHDADPGQGFAIPHVGSPDKTALISGILVLLAVFAAVIGVLARRWLAAGLAGLAAFGALGVSAALTRPAAGPSDALTSALAISKLIV